MRARRPLTFCTASNLHKKMLFANGVWPPVAHTNNGALSLGAQQETDTTPNACALGCERKSRRGETIFLVLLDARRESGANSGSIVKSRHKEIPINLWQIK